MTDWLPDYLRDDDDDAPKEQDRATSPSMDSDSPQSQWIEPMSEDAFHGVAGDAVRLIAPYTEADSALMLVNFLVFAGVLFGRNAWIVADGAIHYSIEYLLGVGKSGFAGRKGTASTRIRNVFDLVDEQFSKRILSSFSTGEGLIAAFERKKDLLIDVEEKSRNFVGMLAEFGHLLSVMEREGNTISATLRDSWDSTRLQVNTRRGSLDVDDVNLSTIAHVTPTELLSKLNSTERANGFANRYLFILSRRSKILPRGGGYVDTSLIVGRMRHARLTARGRGEVHFSSKAGDLWDCSYPWLTRERDGLFEALCGRADAHTIRLALIYCLLDGSDQIREEHLRAAFAVWDFCERGIRFIFPDISGNSDRDKILDALASGPMTNTEISILFKNNKNAESIAGMMMQLCRDGLVVQTTKPGKGVRMLAAWGLKKK